MAAFTIFLVYVLNTIILGIPTTAISDHIFIGNETDCLALIAIKSKIIHDPQGVLRSWNESVDFCLWEGITCGHSHKRVSALNLPAKGLVGTLSPFVGNLSFLHELRLTNNTFSSHIPPEVGRLFRLQRLILINNSFQGEIPTNISGCLQLEMLRLGHNNLVGKIPSELSFLSKLKVLGLDYNNLTGDDLSPLSNLTSLQNLYLSGQIYQGLGFQGTIPDFIGNFKDLKVLALGGNSFTGKIPPSLYNLSMIQIFSLTMNLLEGSLPPDLGLYFPQLQSLHIGNNQLTGQIPLSLSNLSSAELIDLSSNNFTGRFLFDGRKMQNLSMLTLNEANLGRGEASDLEFLDSLVNCSRLEILDIRDNYFGGTIPHSIANLSTHLRILPFSNNQISGRIPSGLGNILNLQLLFLRVNQFTGTVPADIGKIPRLQYADFSNNQLSGRIPLSLGNLSWLSTLFSSQNKFQGIVPITLGNSKSLLEIHLSQNNLVGYIPRQLFQASALVELHLDHNQLQGSLPSEIGNLRNLVVTDLSNNNLFGNIPSSLGQCVSLTNLHLGVNSFVGFVPKAFSLLKDLKELDLSHNKLSGQVPNYLSGFSSLTLLNLSFNNLEGEIPTKGVFANVSAISLVGNRNLCGGIPQLKLAACPTTESKGNKKSHAVIIAVSISCVLVGLAIVSSVCLLHPSRGRKFSSSGMLSKEPFHKVSYDMLLKATDGFSPANLIGSGSFGSVYKGALLLKGEERAVAIKVMSSQRRGATKSFIAECEALRIIRHRNLVRVITACSSIDFQGNVFKALVYELMSKGNLECWLHSNPEDNDQNLTLLQRLNIAIDVVYALDYIHNGNDTPIIHCDLKPTNILLHEDMTAQVGDFGLVKLLPEISEPLHNSSSIGVRGTVGYAPPEYGLGTSVSPAGDVYSYGIIILEMMTAKKPTDMIFEGDTTLHKFAESAFPDHVLGILDPRLKVDDDEESNITSNDTRIVTKCAFECMTLMIMIGVRCSSEFPQDRMHIQDVIRQLQSQTNHLLLCGRQHRCQHIL